MEIKKKLIGCCSVCDKEVFKILEVYPQEHPYAGEPRRAGRPLEDAVRATILLTDGKKLDITLCEACYEVSELHISLIWKRLLYSWAQEVTPENLQALGKPQLNKRQREQVDKWLVEMQSQAILGIVYAERWTEIKERENG